MDIESIQAIIADHEQRLKKLEKFLPVIPKTKRKRQTKGNKMAFYRKSILEGPMNKKKSPE